MSKREALVEKKKRKDKKEEKEESGSEVEDSGSERPTKQVTKEGEEYWALTKSKRLSVGSFKGRTNISLREYFEKDGEWLPTKKGITLSLENWQILKKLIKEVDQVIEAK